MCGTSMATPAVTGVVALMIEKMVKLGKVKSDIYPSTYKALLIHGAEDLGRPGPDFEYGYGRVRVGPTLQLMDDKAFEQVTIEAEGQVVTRTVSVAPNASELKVTLVWDDPPNGTLAEDALTNDLDLVLVSPAGDRRLPFVLDPTPGREAEPAKSGEDHLNVVEQVLVRQPQAGTWSIEVRFSKKGGAGGQTFSLVTSVR